MYATQDADEERLFLLRSIFGLSADGEEDDEMYVDNEVLAADAIQVRWEREISEEGTSDDDEIEPWWVEGAPSQKATERWYLLIPDRDVAEATRAWSGRQAKGVGWVLQDRLFRIRHCGLSN